MMKDCRKIHVGERDTMTNYDYLYKKNTTAKVSIKTMK